MKDLVMLKNKLLMYYAIGEMLGLNAETDCVDTFGEICMLGDGVVAHLRRLLIDSGHINMEDRGLGVRPYLTQKGKRHAQELLIRAIPDVLA